MSAQDDTGPEEVKKFNSELLYSACQQDVLHCLFQVVDKVWNKVGIIL
jgi:hypothetical protein